MNIFNIWGWLIVTCTVLGPVAVHAELPPGNDLARSAAEARARRVPLLIAFMQQTCPYCAVARNNHLIPLLSDPKWKNHVLIREIDVDRSIRMRNFSGESVTHREFAKQYGVRRVPTLIVFDADGKPAAPPIVGLLVDEFYQIYIEQAIEAGLHKMRPSGR